MTRTERERLVEGYLEGGMTSAEEQEFFIQVALDDELRRTLKAYSVVEKAIRMEREVDVVSHAAARRAVAASLLPSQVRDREMDPRRRRRWGISTLGGLVIVLLLGMWLTVGRERPAADSPSVRLPETVESTAEQPAVSDPTPSADTVVRSDVSKEFDRPLRPASQIRERRSLPSASVREESTEPELTTDRESEPAPDQVSSQDEAPEAKSPVQRAESPDRIDSTAGRSSDADDPELPIEIDWEGSDE